MEPVSPQGLYDCDIDLWKISSYGIRFDLETLQEVSVEAVCEAVIKPNQTADLFVGVRVLADARLIKTITLSNFTSGGILSKFGNDRTKNQMQFAIALVELVAKQIELNAGYPSPEAYKIRKRIRSDIGIVDLVVPPDFDNFCALPYPHAVACIRFEESQFHLSQPSRVSNKKNLFTPRKAEAVSSAPLLPAPPFEGSGHDGENPDPDALS